MVDKTAKESQKILLSSIKTRVDILQFLIEEEFFLKYLGIFHDEEMGISTLK